MQEEETKWERNEIAKDWKIVVEELVEALCRMSKYPTFLIDTRSNVEHTAAKRIVYLEPLGRRAANCLDLVTKMCQCVLIGIKC